MLLSYVRFGEIPSVAVVGIFAISIVCFVLLLILFLKTNTNDTSCSYPVDSYKFWRLITKEGYITMAVCIAMMSMLLMM